MQSLRKTKKPQLIRTAKKSYVLFRLRSGKTTDPSNLTFKTSDNCSIQNIFNNRVRWLRKQLVPTSMWLIAYFLFFNFVVAKRVFQNNVRICYWTTWFISKAILQLLFVLKLKNYRNLHLRDICRKKGNWYVLFVPHISLVQKWVKFYYV